MTNEEKNENLMKNISEVRAELNDEQRALEKEIAKLRDPTVHAAIMYTAAKERESTNRILKNILARIDSLELKISRVENEARSVAKAGIPEVALSDVDKSIIAFIKSSGACTAENIQQTLRYKGRNAACARLNRLYELGILEKQRSGKKIIYTAR